MHQNQADSLDGLKTRDVKASGSDCSSNDAEKLVSSHEGSNGFKREVCVIVTDKKRVSELETLLDDARRELKELRSQKSALKARAEVLQAESMRQKRDIALFLEKDKLNDFLIEELCKRVA
jgi:hypothetical protein